MTRPIKFRGRTCGNIMVYGDLRHVGTTAVIDDTAVYEDSIAQLVGYDTNGNEVYEGDYVYVRTNRGNITFKPATMIDIHLVHTYKLKETSDNA